MPLTQTSNPYAENKPLAEIGRVLNVELIGLLPEQVKEHWAVWVERLAKVGLPEELKDNEGALLQVFSHCITGTIRCVLITVEGEHGRTLIAQMLLAEIAGNFGGDKVLLLWALQGLQEVPLPVWKLAFERLKKVAKDRECSHIQASTVTDNVVKLAEALGATTFTSLDWRV